MFKKMKVTLAVLVSAGAITIAACTNESKENITPDNSGNNCDSTGITYSNYVKSVIDANCATSGCHDPGTQSSGYNLSTYAGVLNVAQTSRQGTSLLLGVINHQSGFTAMPESLPKLDVCTINKITAWVNNGEPQ